MFDRDTIPASNLPNRSIPWGRRLENVNFDTARSIDSVRGDINSQNRNNATTVATIGEQVQDLQSRIVEYVSISQKYVTVGLPVTNAQYNYSGSFSLDIPPPLDGAKRQATVLFSFGGYVSQSGTIIGNVAVSIIGAGLHSPINSGVVANPDPLSAPAGWVGTEMLVGSAVTSGETLTVRFFGNVSRFGATPSSVNIGLQNISCAIIYGERVE